MKTTVSVKNNVVVDPTRKPVTVPSGNITAEEATQRNEIMLKAIRERSRRK